MAQLASQPGNVPHNLTRALEAIDAAKSLGAGLVLFPELYLHGYSANELFADIAEPVPGPSTETLIGVAARLDLYLVMGLARLDESFPSAIYNSACLIGPTGLIGIFDKVHLANYSLDKAHTYVEGVWFAPGNHAPVFRTGLGDVSLQICADAFFPELTRRYALDGSLLNIVISAGPESSRERWSSILQARSIENAMHSVYCNAVGEAGALKFFGGSRIVSPSGSVVVQGPEGREDIVVGSIDFSESAAIRRRRRMFMDRRPDIYDSDHGSDVAHRRQIGQ